MGRWTPPIAFLCECLHSEQLAGASVPKVEGAAELPRDERLGQIA